MTDSLEQIYRRHVQEMDQALAAAAQPVLAAILAIPPHDRFEVRQYLSTQLCLVCWVPLRGRARCGACALKDGAP